MGLDLAGGPLIDSEDFAKLAESGYFGRWLEQAIAMNKYGYCLVDLDSAVFRQKCQTLVTRLQSQLSAEIQSWRAGTSGPPRLQDEWTQNSLVRELALLPTIVDLLTRLYGRHPFAFQTLNFAVGSQQPVHSDAVHFHSFPMGFMCGVWIALEDVVEGSGPLMYYPESHRLRYLSAENLQLRPDQVKSEIHPQVLFQNSWDEMILQHGLKKHHFYPKCGQILIWHANLLHGGEAVVDRSASRWSQVNHYYFADCLYTTPMHSYSPDGGGTSLRNPLDINTGKKRYSEVQWQALGIRELTSKTVNN
jgi:hypothetical protein